MLPKETVVLKFGGAAVARLEDYDVVAGHVIEQQRQGLNVIAVVSAMQGMTDSLLTMARQVNADPPRRECDMLISVGERISCALLAMALAKVGVGATSFTGSQAGVITCENHTDARIVDVRPRRVRDALERGLVAVVAGFQGVSAAGSITTLGRSGSDTSAVALAAAFGAGRVIFYKDVPGVFDGDPKCNAEARHLPIINYEEALALTARCGFFLHPRCIKLAWRNGIALLVRHHGVDSALSTTIQADGAPLRGAAPCYEDEAISQ